jgi:hypothetical protein
MFPTRSSSFPYGRPPRGDSRQVSREPAEVTSPDGRRRSSRYREVIRCLRSFRCFQLVVKVTGWLEAGGAPDLGAAPVSLEVDSFLSGIQSPARRALLHLPALVLDLPRQERTKCWMYAFLHFPVHSLIYCSGVPTPTPKTETALTKLTFRRIKWTLFLTSVQHSTQLSLLLRLSCLLYSANLKLSQFFSDFWFSPGLLLYSCQLFKECWCSSFHQFSCHS